MKQKQHDKWKDIVIGLWVSLGAMAIFLLGIIWGNRIEKEFGFPYVFVSYFEVAMIYVSMAVMLLGLTAGWVLLWLGLCGYGHREKKLKKNKEVR